MCRAHAAVRHLIGGMLAAPEAVTIVDMEAGVEHLSRGTGRHVDTVLVVMEPYFRALETARRAAELARELGIARVAAIGNKVRNEEDRRALRAFAADHHIDVIGEVPYDEAVRDAEAAGRAPIDAGSSPAIRAVEQLAARLDLSAPSPTAPAL